MGKRGRFEQERRKKPANGKRTLLIVIAALLAVLILAMAAGVMVYQSILNEIPRAEHVVKPVSQEKIDAIMNYNPDAPADAPAMATEATPETQPTESVETTQATEPYIPSKEDVVNVLLVGQAARAGEEHRMADTMILISINKHTKVMTLTSFLRDTYVKLPNYRDLSGRKHECGEQKLTVCYHLGYTFGGTADAMLMTNQCLLENFGVEVDYNVEVDFEGVIQIVDYLGGIEVDLTEAEAKYLDDDRNYRCEEEITAGPRVLDGTATLAYARMRKADGDGESDIKRTGRQRFVLEKLMEKARSMDVAGMGRVAKDFLPWITTNMTNAEITKCMAEIFPILPELTIETGTCPVETTYRGEIITLGDYPASILRFDRNQNIRLMRRITEGATE